MLTVVFRDTAALCCTACDTTASAPDSEGSLLKFPDCVEPPDANGLGSSGLFGLVPSPKLLAEPALNAFLISKCIAARAEQHRHSGSQVKWDVVKHTHLACRAEANPTKPTVTMYTMMYTIHMT